MVGKLLLVLTLLTVWYVLPHCVASAGYPQCDNRWCEDTVEAGGKVHNIGYPETLLSEALAAREAVTQSIHTLLMGSTIHWLQDGQPADLCNPPDTFTVALSRTGTLNSQVNAGIELLEIDAESATCLAQETVLPDCMVGRWRTTEMPEIATPYEFTMMWEPNNYYIEFRSDGTFDGVTLNLVSVA